MDKIICDKCKIDLNELGNIKLLWIFPKKVEREHYMIFGFEKKIHLCRDCANKFKLWLK